MRNLAFPTTIVDNFFDEPDVVRDFALAQEFYKDDANKWPGKRSKNLWEICPQLFENSINKIIDIFYEPKIHNYCWEASANFQIINKEYGSGWVHQDETIVTGIVYLSKEYENSGTTLYEAKNSIEASLINFDKKQESFKNLETLENNSIYREENNNQYKPSITVEGKYNRLLVFDSHLLHSANDFCDERLTLVIFLRKFITNGSLYPIQRMHRNI
jgi:hypothetical protein